MKKNILLICLCLAFMSSFSQQKGTNEVGITFGGLSSNEFLSVTNQIIESILTPSNTSYQYESTSPAITMNYKYAIKNKWFLFADGAYQAISENVLVNDIKTGDIKNTFLTLGLGTEYHYVSKDWFQMYSGVSIAYTFQFVNYTGNTTFFKDGNSSFLNFQINAFGFRIGKKFAGILEFGAGYKGIANLGLNYQF